MVLLFQTLVNDSDADNLRFNLEIKYIRIAVVKYLYVFFSIVYNICIIILYFPWQIIFLNVYNCKDGIEQVASMSLCKWQISNHKHEIFDDIFKVHYIVSYYID